MVLASWGVFLRDVIKYPPGCEIFSPVPQTDIFRFSFPPYRPHGGCRRPSPPGTPVSRAFVCVRFGGQTIDNLNSMMQTTLPRSHYGWGCDFSDLVTLEAISVTKFYPPPCFWLAQTGNPPPPKPPFQMQANDWPHACYLRFMPLGGGYGVSRIPIAR